MTAFVLLLACGQGVIALGDDANNPGTNEPGTGDTGEPVDEPEIHPASGAYDTQVYWEILDFDWTLCDGEDFTLEVDDEGNVSGDGTCIYYGDRDDYDMDFVIEGAVDDDGEVTGTIEFDVWEVPGNDWELNTIDGDLDGTIEDGEVSLGFYGYANYDGYYGYGDLDAYGEIWGDAE